MELFIIGLCFLQAFIYIFFTYRILQKRGKYLSLILFVTIEFINLFIHQYYSLTNISLVLFSVTISFVYACCINKKEYMQNLFLAVYTYTIYLISSFVIIFLTTYFHSNPQHNQYFYTLFPLLVTLLNGVILFVSSQFIIKYHYLKTTQLIWIIICLITIDCSNAAIFEIIQIYNIYNFFSYFICISSIIIPFMLIVFFFLSQLEQNKLLRLQKEKTELENHKIIQKINADSVTELRKWKHDIKHIFQTMKYYLDEKNINKLYALINQYSDNLNKNQLLIETGHPLLDSILIQKNNLIQNNHIDMIVSYDGSIIPLEDSHFFIVVGNLMDNAIENVDSTYLKQIKLEIGKINDFFFIKIQNSIINSVILQNQNLLTSKKNREEHGLGLKNIKSILHKYNGEISFCEQENFFIVKILIPYSHSL